MARSCEFRRPDALSLAPAVWRIRLFGDGFPSPNKRDTNVSGCYSDLRKPSRRLQAVCVSMAFHHKDA
jgi:hypothetical protein